MSTSVPGMMSVACRGPAPRTHCFCIRAHGQYVAVARHASRHVFLNVRSAQRVEVAAAGPGTVAGETGTVTILDELRTASMRLHTKDQAPQEGGQPAAKNPFESWAPNRAGYLRYLAEAKLVFDALEEIIRESTNPWFLALQNNGLERGPALQKDLDWFKATYNMTVECPADSAGHEYARVLRELASTNPPAFLCHYYNIYFAHTAGGRMIGKKASDACLDGAKLEFYQYEGALKRLTDDVREVVIDIGTKMTPEERKVCVDETPKTFQYAGGLMKYMMNTSD